MKVVCIKEFKSQALQYELTKGKVYETHKPNWPRWFENHFKDSYFIMCDRGFISAYKQNSFVTLAEYRKLKLEELGI
jgi:hypothetical protein